jgi:Flp pilus assembly protein TadG
MKRALRLGDEHGASAVEFALTAPIFFLMIFGIITFGLMLWTQFGLQHGAEMAARCATVNTTTCNNTTNIKSFASSNAYGLHPDPSVFTVSTPACGNQVSASYSFQFPTTYLGMSPLTLTAQSCFPK